MQFSPRGYHGFISCWHSIFLIERNAGRGIAWDPPPTCRPVAVDTSVSLKTHSLMAVFRAHGNSFAFGRSFNTIHRLSEYTFIPHTAGGVATIANSPLKPNTKRFKYTPEFCFCFAISFLAYGGVRSAKSFRTSLLKILPTPNLPSMLHYVSWGSSRKIATFVSNRHTAR